MGYICGAIVNLHSKAKIRTKCLESVGVGYFKRQIVLKMPL
jgi:hypothetical protein